MIKPTKQEFIDNVLKPAIKKWKGGVKAEVKVWWWDCYGREYCSFCRLFKRLRNCGACPIYDGIRNEGAGYDRCAKEWVAIHESREKLYAGKIQLASFIRTFNRNAPKLLARIKAVRYEDITVESIGV